MNIAELRNAPPQTSQYLEAQLLSIGLAKVVNTQRSGQRCVQELQVVDRQGQQEKIAYWFDADKPDFAMPPQQVNQWLTWKVKTKPNGQYLNISGYPEKAAQQQTPPQGFHPQPAQLNPQAQEIIDQQFKQPSPQQAAAAIQDHMAGPVNSVDPTSNVPDRPAPTAQDYAAKEREKVLGMCFTNLLAGKVVSTMAVDLEQDMGEIAALWRLAAICIDGTGRVGEEPSF